MLAGFLNSPVTAGRGNVFIATCATTAMPAFSATALGGPLLYNGSSATLGGTAGRGVTAYLLAISFGVSVAATAAAAIGIVAGATTAPTSTSVSGLLVSNMRLKAAASLATPRCTAYASGTVSVAGTLWWPVGQIGTAALTAEVADDNIVQLGGALEISPGFFACPATGATLSTAVTSISIIWAEEPITA